MASIAEIIRAAAALRGAKYRYTAASEAHASRESLLLLVGEERAADLHHRADLIATRALMAEMDDPAPKRAESGCGVCPGPCDECELCA